MAGIKDELAKKDESTKGETKLTKSMSIADLILLKISLEKSKVLNKDGNPIIKVVLENLGSNPIQSLNIINRKDRLIKNEFPESNYEAQYVFITNVSSDIKDSFSYNTELNEYCFDLSEYKGQFKVLCLGLCNPIHAFDVL